jgi:hypothetical protein
MPNNLTMFFCRNDGQRERIPLGKCSITKALEAAQRVFHISDGLYTKAELYKGDELIETLPNPASVHGGSILVQ